MLFLCALQETKDAKKAKKSNTNGEDQKMVEALDPKIIEKPSERCSECDRVTEHYNTHVSPTNERRNICWECQMREEKNFFAKRDFRRRSRSGVIPR